jgi:hypothetical protein
MKLGLTALAVVGLGAMAVPALADRTDVLYSYKSWQVEGVTFDDGTYACLAEVSDPGESFSIWTFPDSTIRLQFYSEADDGCEPDQEFGAVRFARSEGERELHRRGRAGVDAAPAFGR